MYLPLTNLSKVSLDFVRFCPLFPRDEPLTCFVASGGLGVIGGDTVNFVGLGGCTPDHYLSNLPGFCDGAVMRSPTMWLGIFTGG